MKPRSLSWPTHGRLAAGLGGAAWVSLVFFPVYLGCAAVTAARGTPWRLYAEWELGLPFVPLMIVPYLSMFVLFLLPPFQLDESELRSLAARLVAGSLLGGLLFLALPAEMGFGPRTDAGVWQAVYSAVYRIDGPFNTVPSFHVMYTTMILLTMIEVATPALRRTYVAWLAVVCTSTVLTHRHHLLDVGSGFLLAIVVPALVRRRGWIATPSTRRLLE